MTNAFHQCTVRINIGYLIKFFLQIVVKKFIAKKPLSEYLAQSYISFKVTKGGWHIVFSNRTLPYYTIDIYTSPMFIPHTVTGHVRATLVYLYWLYIDRLLQKKNLNNA